MMNKLKTVLILALSAPVLVSAQTPGLPTGLTQPPVSSITTVSGLFQIVLNLVKWVYTLLIVLVVVMMLYAGYLYLTGTEENIKKAKTQLIYIVIGVVVIILSFGAQQIITTFLNSSGAT